MNCSKKRGFAQIIIDDECDVTKFKKWEWDRRRALMLRGSAASGKTNWAIAQFSKPVLIGDVDDLKGLPEGCDGLVFDEVLFNLCSKKTNVNVTDMKFERTIRCRNSNGKIPKGMPRIFCCNNDEDVFLEHEAMSRRVVKCEVDTQF